MIGRRDFIALLGGSAATWPFAAQAQQQAMPVVGFLGTGYAEAEAHRVTAFRQGLKEFGFVESQNVTIEFRWAQNDNARLPGLADELARRRVTVIAAPFSTPAALAAKAATTTIPIVFSMGGDPVQLGLVASLSRPGGNVTGLSYMAVQLAAKRVELLHELVPGASRFDLLVNPTNPLTESLTRDAQAAASATWLRVDILSASTDRDIDSAFASLVQKRGDALMVGLDTLFANRRVELALLAVRHAIPTIFPFSDDA